MTGRNEARPPLPTGCFAAGESQESGIAERSRGGEGAGGEGRANAPKTTKLGHGWAPGFGETRQKDQVRTRERAKRLRRDMTRLLIEIDGSIHERADVQANDKAKEIYAITRGFRVLRVANNDAWDRPAWVVSQVCDRLSAPHPPTPSPQGGRGEET